MDVTKGWSGSKEINRVIYDPNRVTVEQMEQWLIESGTYIETLVPAGNDKEKRE